MSGASEEEGINVHDESINIEVLNEYVYLADTLSYKRTADHFYVSKSVISRHIAALEDVLGVRLLERGSRGVALTEAGREFYREALIVLCDWGSAVQRARDVAAGHGKVVRIGYLRNAARPVLVRFSRYMADSHPDIRLELTCMEYNELRRAMDSHDVDVALAVNVNPALSRNWRSTHIYDDEFFAVCSFDHPLAAQAAEGVSFEDLRTQKLLLPDSYIYAGLAEIIDGLMDDKMLLAAQAYYRDIDMLYLKVQTEGYVAFSSSMNNAMFGDRLAALPVHGVNTTFSVSAFYHDEFVGQTFEAVSEGFAWCSRELVGWKPEIRLEFFGQ